MNLYYLADAIQLIRPGSEFTLTGNDINNIQWVSLVGEVPSLQELQDALTQVESIRLQQQEDRAAQKQALLNRLGITEEEAQLLLS